MQKRQEIHDIPRHLVHNHAQMPFMTIIIIKEGDSRFHAWQPEYNICKTGCSMEEVILHISTTMGELIADEHYDYIHKEPDGNTYYDLPVPMLPEDYAQDMRALLEIMEELFDTGVSKEQVFFASAAPRIL